MTPDTLFIFMNVYAILFVSSMIFAVIAVIRRMWQRAGMYVIAFSGSFIGFCTNLWEFRRWMVF